MELDKIEADLIRNIVIIGTNLVFFAFDKDKLKRKAVTLYCLFKCLDVNKTKYRLFVFSKKMNFGNFKLLFKV